MADDETIRLRLDLDAAEAQRTIQATTASTYEFAQSIIHVSGETYEFADEMRQAAPQIDKVADAYRRARMSAEEYLATQIKTTDQAETAARASNSTALRVGNLNTIVQQTAYSLGDFASTSGDLGQKLMSVSNNVQFVAAGFGAWGAAAGLLTVVLASAIRNADSFSGILSDQYLKPEVIDKTKLFGDKLHENEKAFDKLRDKVSLAADEQKRFNDLQKEGLELAKLKKDAEEAERQQQQKGEATEDRGQGVADAIKKVGGHQAQLDIYQQLIEANPHYDKSGLYKMAQDLRVKGAQGDEEADKFLRDLFAGKGTAFGDALLNAPGQVKAELGHAEKDRQAEKAKKDQEEALAKVRKRFGSLALEEWEKLTRAQRDKVFQKGDTEATAYERWATARAERVMAEAEADPGVKAYAERQEREKPLTDKERQERELERTHKGAVKEFQNLPRTHPVLAKLIEMEKRERALEKQPGATIQSATAEAIREATQGVHSQEEMRVIMEAAQQLINDNKMRVAAHSGMFNRPKKAPKGPVNLDREIFSKQLVPRVQQNVQQGEEMLRMAENMGMSLSELKARQDDLKRRMDAMNNKMRGNFRRGN